MKMDQNDSNGNFIPCVKKKLNSTQQQQQKLQRIKLIRPLFRPEDDRLNANRRHKQMNNVGDVQMHLASNIDKPKI
ncbi:hypothetical protein DERP_000444 [Dermatophagoides pteronyssinus]|uniref:Uncharacterized protein n=1 Tax=Dermatophagoides pteronyssinus TaxID=6956 RepID=A0ABQ8J0Q4_DERPT|nr:hypothetical protein DERP_000444 [Dermatophagoides pteronyssinus]